MLLTKMPQGLKQNELPLRLQKLNSRLKKLLRNRKLQESKPRELPNNLRQLN